MLNNRQLKKINKELDEHWHILVNEGYKPDTFLFAWKNCEKFDELQKKYKFYLRLDRRKGANKLIAYVAYFLYNLMRLIQEIWRL